MEAIILVLRSSSISWFAWSLIRMGQRSFNRVSSIWLIDYSFHLSKPIETQRRNYLMLENSFLSFIICPRCSLIIPNMILDTSRLGRESTMSNCLRGQRVIRIGSFVDIESNWKVIMFPRIFKHGLIWFLATSSEE